MESDNYCIKPHFTPNLDGSDAVRLCIQEINAPNPKNNPTSFPWTTVFFPQKTPNLLSNSSFFETTGKTIHDNQMIERPIQKLSRMFKMTFALFVDEENSNFYNLNGRSWDIEILIVEDLTNVDNF
jgi:hypothetical protein